VITVNYTDFDKDLEILSDLSMKSQII